MIAYLRPTDELATPQSTTNNVAGKDDKIPPAHVTFGTAHATDGVVSHKADGPSVIPASKFADPQTKVVS